MTKIEKAENEVIAQKCASTLREELKLGTKPISDIRSLVSTKDFILLMFPTEMPIDGLSLMKLDKGNPVNCIYVNTYRPKGRVNFTIAHELYHIYFEKSSIDKVTTKSKKDPVEYRAELFASHFLVPREEIIEILERKNLSNTKSIEMSDIFEIQKYFEVSFQAIIQIISSLKNTEYSYLVPNNISNYGKYFQAPYWDELEKLTARLDCDNNLNAISLEYYLPAHFETIIRENLRKGKTDVETASSLLNFFLKDL